MHHVIINEKGSQRVHQGHPWVFRSDIVSAPDEYVPGEVVLVKAKNGKVVGQAFFNPISQISLRFLTRQAEPTIEEQGIEFWRERIKASILRRETTQDTSHSGQRLVYGEADFLPALIVDRYRDVVVFQTLCAGIDLVRDDIMTILQEELNPSAIVERNDVGVRELEGLEKQKGIVFGSIPEGLEIKEGDNWFSVDPLEGQKTGMFLDQSANHILAGRYTKGRTLDLFTYQGGFSLAVSPHADEVIAVDSSGPALENLKKNAERNSRTNIKTIEANVFDFLRESYDKGEVFDTIVLDPPPFMKSKKNMKTGLAGYKEINLRAMKILKKEGILITASCSQNFTPELFKSVLEEAARDAKKQIQVLEICGPSTDHPTLLNFPESNYLQCWFLRVI